MIYTCNSVDVYTDTCNCIYRVEAGKCVRVCVCVWNLTSKHLPTRCNLPARTVRWAAEWSSVSVPGWPWSAGTPSVAAWTSSGHRQQGQCIRIDLVLRLLQYNNNKINSRKISVNFPNAERSPRRYWRGPRSQSWGMRETAYLSLHRQRQSDSSIKMGSGESHFNVSLIVRDTGTRQCPQTITFEEKGEPKRNRAEALLLTSLYNALPLAQ